MKELEAIKARAEAATEGPWDVFAAVNGGEVNEEEVEVGPDCEPTVATIDGLDNADFIAHARTDIPKLISALEAVSEGLSGLEAIFDGPGDDDEAIRTISQGLRDAISEALA